MKQRLRRDSGVYTLLRRLRNASVTMPRRLTGVHATASIHRSSHVARDLRAGPYVFVGRDCLVPPGVTIGAYSMLASAVAIVGDDHDWQDPTAPMQFSGRPEQHDTAIGRDVWLGHGVIVLRGLRVGDGSIVAAGAVVTRDVGEREVWAGVPARKLRNRFADPGAAEAHRRMLDGPLLAPRFADPLTAAAEPS